VKGNIMPTKYLVRVEANTPVGTFEGYSSRPNDPFEVRENAEQARDTIEKNISNFGFFVLFSADGKQEITLPGETIRNSVLVFSISELNGSRF
jgi:hypothetical protein